MTVTVNGLHAALLAGDSATEVLERLFGVPPRAEKLPPTREGLAGGVILFMATGQTGSLTYRRTRLFCGITAVSDADLWFDPARLHDPMLDRLNTTSDPFGRVIVPLRPQRRTVSARIFAPGAPYALFHHAVLTTPDNRMIAEVAEHYCWGAVAAT